MTEHHGLIHLRGNRLLDSAPHRPGTERDNRKWQPKGAGKYGYQALEPSTTAYLGMSESAETAYVSFEHRTDGHDDSGTWDTWGDDGDGYLGMSESAETAYVSFEHRTDGHDDSGTWDTWGDDGDGDDESGEGWNAWTDLPGQPAGITSHGEDLTVSDEETAIALNAMEECDFENFPDATAEAIQLQCAAHMVMGKAGRGKGKQGKEKGGFPVVRSGLSVEDRKKRLQEIKSRSKLNGLVDAQLRHQEQKAQAVKHSEKAQEIKYTAEAQEVIIQASDRYQAETGEVLMPSSWWEASWGLYPGGTWVFLAYASAGQTEIDRGRAGECEFILAAQFPYDAGADSQPYRGTQKSAYLASKVMTKGQSNAFSRELQMLLGDMDLFTAKVAGVPTQHEDPKSSVRTPNSTIMIHDNFPVNIPGMSEHSSKDFKWNRFN
eukprot:s7627_g3.t1